MGESYFHEPGKGPGLPIDPDGRVNLAPYHAWHP
jgi:hypothetical protein